MSCPICISNYNKSTCAKVTCMCDYSACKTCIRTYLLTTTQEPHCMNCRNKWSYEFTKESLGASFVNGDLKEHQRKILLDSAIARREERMQGAINYRDDRADKQTIKEIKLQVEQKKQELVELLNQIEDVENNIRVRNGQRAYYRNYRRYPIIDNQPTASNTATVIEKRKFVMPCQKSDCNGMLNEQYLCALCNTTTCKNCLEPELENHACNPETVETAKMIRKESKPCPKCGVRISKIDGCDQMWCVECKTAFSWKTGEIETRNIHNPHYFQFLRDRGGAVPRNPHDEPQCRPRYLRDDAIHKLGRIYRASKDNNYKVKVNRMMDYLEYSNHIMRVTVTQHEDRINTKNNNIDNEYLYILGEISKETLGSRLMSNHKAVQTDQVFLDIYRAIVLMSDQICGDITNNTTINVDDIDNTINKWSAYFNMELIKALMLHDSKREIIIFMNWTKITKKYENKNTMTEDMKLFKDIYEGVLVVVE